MGWWRCRTSSARDSWIDWRDARTSAQRLINATIDGLVKPEAIQRRDTSARASRSSATTRDPVTQYEAVLAFFFV